MKGHSHLPSSYSQRIPCCGLAVLQVIINWRLDGFVMAELVQTDITRRRRIYGEPGVLT